MQSPKKQFNIRHRCFFFSRDIIRFCTENKPQRIHFSLFEQLIRSATSISANLVEGGGGSSKRDFLKFMFISLKSANETKLWLCLIRDGLNLHSDKLKLLLKEADEISKILAKIILNTKAKESF